MAKRIQNNILAKDVITQSVVSDSDPELALAGLDAFQFLNIKPLA
jgi:hypothetical protein